MNFEELKLVPELLRALADCRYLFAEDLFASRSLQVAELGIEARLLFHARCPGVTDPHPISLSR